MNIQQTTLLPFKPEVRVLPAHQDEEDPSFVHPAQIAVDPYGTEYCGTVSHYWSMDIDEARQLVAVLQAAILDAGQILGAE